MTPAGPPTGRLRRDAARNRDAVVAAATTVFAEEGVQAPMARVAQVAGVGRATVQRHFPDRHALAAAVYSRQLGEVEQHAAEHVGEPGLLEDVLRRVVEIQAHAVGLLQLLRSAPGSPVLEDLQDRLTGLMAPLVEAAVAQGELAPGTDVMDIHLVLAMTRGVVASYPDGDARTAAVERALTLALGGLRAR